MLLLRKPMPARDRLLSLPMRKYRQACQLPEIYRVLEICRVLTMHQVRKCQELAMRQVLVLSEVRRMTGDVVKADDRAASILATTGPARRALLIASAAALPVLLTACNGIQVLGAPPAPSADVDTLRSAIDHEAALVANYVAVTEARGSAGTSGAAASGRMAVALATVLSEHRQHLAQLKSRLVEPAGRQSATAHSPAAAGAGATGAGGRGSGVILTLAQLERAEQAASDRLIAQLTDLPAGLAQLFASIAASEATHVPYLRAARRRR